MESLGWFDTGVKKQKKGDSGDTEITKSKVLLNFKPDILTVSFLFYSVSYFSTLN